MWWTVIINTPEHPVRWMVQAEDIIVAVKTAVTNEPCAVRLVIKAKLKTESKGWLKFLELNPGKDSFRTVLKPEYEGDDQ